MAHTKDGTERSCLREYWTEIDLIGRYDIQADSSKSYSDSPDSFSPVFKACSSFDDRL
jgi:hypothetical protein